MNELLALEQTLLRDRLYCPTVLLISSASAVVG